jgi:hypothetical protein
MKKRVALAVLCLLCPIRAACGEASYLLIGGDLPISASSNGYSQVVSRQSDGSTEVRVATTLTPIGASGTYAEIFAAERPQVPSGFALPKSLLNELRPDLEAWQAATAILEWTALRVAVDVKDNGAQDAVSVLARGRGRCSGIANATAALLRAGGFEARTVSGLLIGDEEAIPHRWIECRLPGAGWVASDPTLGLWTVTPRHLVFADTVTDLPEVRVLSASDDGLHLLPTHGGRLMRPNDGAHLVCRLASDRLPPDAVAILTGAGEQIRRARFGPEAHFEDLLPGRWILEIRSGELILERRRITLKEGDYRIYVIDPEGEHR